MTAEELQAAIQSEYPEIWGLINQEGVYNVLIQAINDNWPASRTQAALEATPYFRNTPLGQRQWDALQATDPATATVQKQNLQQTISMFANQYNTQADPTLLNWALNTGASVSDIEARIRAGSGYYNKQRAAAASAAYGTIQKATEDYALPMSSGAVQGWAQSVGNGDVTLSQVMDTIREQAKSLYPSLSDAIDKGVTVKQYTDPYAQVASQELGINPADFNLRDTKWAAPIQQIDQKTGARTAMTLADWTRTIRSDPIYGYDTTPQANDQAAQLTSRLAQTFGAI